MSSYVFSESVNFQSVLRAGGLFALLRTLAMVLILAVALAGVFAVVVAFWLPICQMVGGLAIIAAFGWVTFPRKRVQK